MFLTGIWGLITLLFGVVLTWNLDTKFISMLRVDTKKIYDKGPFTSKLWVKGSLGLFQLRLTRIKSSVLSYLWEYKAGNLHKSRATHYLGFTPIFINFDANPKAVGVTMHWLICRSWTVLKARFILQFFDGLREGLRQIHSPLLFW